MPTLIVGHRKDAIVTFLTVMHDWPCNRSTEKNNREGSDLRRATALEKCDDERDDPHRQSVNRQWIDQDMNVFRLTKILTE